MKRYIKSSEEIPEGGVILYRSGSTDPDTIANSDRGVFFTTGPDYFDNHPYITFKEEFRRYVLLPNARVWDPKSEFEFYEAENWDKIVCRISDLEKFGLEDECDWEIDEGYGITSTDGLAIAGKELGYDATVIRDVWYFHGSYDEYTVYNPAVIQPF